MGAPLHHLQRHLRPALRLQRQRPHTSHCHPLRPLQPADRSTSRKHRPVLGLGRDTPQRLRRHRQTPHRRQEPLQQRQRPRPHGDPRLPRAHPVGSPKTILQQLHHQLQDPHTTTLHTTLEHHASPLRWPQDIHAPPHIPLRRSHATRCHRRPHPPRQHTPRPRIQLRRLQHAQRDRQSPHAIPTPPPSSQVLLGLRSLLPRRPQLRSRRIHTPKPQTLPQPTHKRKRLRPIPTLRQHTPQTAPHLRQHQHRHHRHPLHTPMAHHPPHHPRTPDSHTPMRRRPTRNRPPLHTRPRPQRPTRPQHHHGLPPQSHPHL